MKFWQGKVVFVTGHSGFKGSWLTLWLQALGAQVVGLALPPDTEPALFHRLYPNGPDPQCLTHHVGDIRDADRLCHLITTSQPDVVFHLAAQPLVRRSYQAPSLTWETNVMGTLNLLEALRTLDRPCAVVVVTSDKVYDNREWLYGYREVDPLGGRDPYSASKAAAELAVQCWRSSFFPLDYPVAIATARSGNVIGGGDWSGDRIVPDAMVALSQGQPIQVRNPQATRPWQHVLEPLGGYLWLAQCLYGAIAPGSNPYAQAFNFGPDLSSNQTVQGLVEFMLQEWPGTWQDCSPGEQPHEAGRLGLVTDKAFHQLGWSPCWSLQEAVRHTVAWYRAVEQGADVQSLCLGQIRAYGSAGAGQPWFKDLSLEDFSLAESATV
ncbi:CDP-glucose 4,6-dehydratase [Prochlorothrix hollandica]|uniref:CDP-glucose 4,6-dehydratase n=1 Tax=Prochlorothrix hollandica PCC 9006 = CALU 1027 TaxID=317619 RepID=A0A0M2PXM9_PROHO|nr:CDP-glucose 4,6-dehydratase [Prochlorothrix hollandica]KKI99141.1 CDP-glucose 4,6-dehydratase [Prochlorothrix hollandica PCC 9006 = CALU 1027]